MIVTMPRYLIRIAADADGRASELEVNAATPWLAVEKNIDRIGAFGAEVFLRGKSLGTVIPLGRGRRTYFTLAGGS